MSALALYVYSVYTVYRAQAASRNTEEMGDGEMAPPLARRCVYICVRYVLIYPPTASIVLALVKLELIDAAIPVLQVMFVGDAGEDIC